MDFRKQQRVHPPIHIDGTAVEKVESFKFLGIHITDKLRWSTHADSAVKKAQQRLFNLRKLNKFGLSPNTLTNFYRCTIEGILSGCITTWYSNCSTHNRRALQRVVRSAQRITGDKLPALQHPMSQQGQKDHQEQQPPGATTCSPRYHPEDEVSTGASKLEPRLKNSFYVKPIRLLNSHH